ncbi:Methyltransferase domain [endosymbiont of Ridgeia piscesae]|uniref:Methyltransferase domain n=2 Tax=endosymbiont of Ridgeia piscesae TaxID=54398 RepID=A0A0T5Z3D1_9GAMM|nr:Methyltransferase domain [endosymbiont of Ridgeia piscesae]KRT57062.1 Methyltransferase domain-containing protein [endosymbiont of Ridgeia piscesae]
MSAKQKMRLNDSQAYQTSTEIDFMERLLPLHGARVLELGCGAAWTLRKLAECYSDSQFIGTEVDEIQHQKNLSHATVNLEFRLEGAQAISEPEQSIDLVCMLKSLHHVPIQLQLPAMQEIHRVLKPGGMAWICEPVYSGAFNAIMSLIHDEKQVREQAFDTLRQVVQNGLFELHAEHFFNVPGSYSWAEFEQRFLNVTHTKIDLSDGRLERVRDEFARHLEGERAAFLKPHRVDLLRKPLG